MGIVSSTYVCNGINRGPLCSESARGYTSDTLVVNSPWTCAARWLGLPKKHARWKSSKLLRSDFEDGFDIASASVQTDISLRAPISKSGSLSLSCPLVSFSFPLSNISL